MSIGVTWLTQEVLQDVIGAKKYTAPAFAQLVEQLKKKLSGGTQTAEEYEKQTWLAAHGASPSTRPAKREKDEDGAVAGKVGNKRQKGARA